MALLKDTWNSGAFCRLVQGENYPYSAIKNAYSEMSKKGNTTGNMNAGLTFNYETSRYPGLYASPRNLVLTQESFKSDTFDGLNIGDITVYNRVQALSFAPRLCPVMQTAKEAAEKIRDGGSYARNYNVEIERVYIQYSGDYGYYPRVNIVNYRDIGDFINSIPDEMLCVNSYKIYENNETEENSIITEWNASTGTPYDMYTPFKFQGPISSPGDFRTAFCGYLTGVLCPKLTSSPIGDLRWINYTMTKIGLNLAVFSNNQTGLYNQNSEQTIIYGNKKAWEIFFNQSGFDWSFDEEEVKNPKGKVYKPVSPGQPDNPVDDEDGDGDNISDVIDYPTVSYLPTAARYMYALTHEKVTAVSNYIYSETFLNDVRRLWTNPGDYIVDISYYPVDFSDSRLWFAPGLDGSPIYIGNLNSGITGKQITGGSTAIYGGYVDVNGYYGSYLDYAPNTSISIYIPYIGIRPLDVDLVNGHRIHLMYYIDLGTGQFIATLGIDGDITQSEIGTFSGSIGQPIAQYSGNIAVHIPLNGTSQNANILNSAVQAMQIVSSAGALAGGAATGNLASVVSGVSGAIGAFSSPTIKEETHGTLTPATGLYTPQTAYLLISRPITAEPEKFKEQIGYSSCYSSTGLGAYTGYLKCAAVELPANSTMTEQEQQEITNLLLGGIYCG